MVKLTVIEILAAAKWVDDHNRIVHNNLLDCADFAIRNIPAGGIGVRTVVTCEACDRVKVRDQNNKDVTDYNAW